MKFAPFANIQCRQGHDYNKVYRGRLEEGELAERLGYDGFYLAEHAFVEHGRPSPAVSLAYIAAKTKRIRIGTAVAVLSWHNPLEVAQDYATLDILTNGRLNFGVGRGGQKHEFDGYGVDWLTSGARYQEALRVVLKAWEGKPFSWDSQFFKFPELTVNPLPIQKPHPPLFQPTLTPESMAAVVPLGVTPIVGASFGSKETIKRNFTALKDILARNNRNDMERIAHPHIFVSDTVEKARKEARESVEWLIDDFAGTFELPGGEKYPPQFAGREKMGQYIRSLTFERIVENDLMWIGDPNSIAERLRWLRDDCGATYILSNMSPGGMEHEKVAKSMELLAKKVWPQL
ncbi:MAG: LLM class flavin-dependent oxidoreductase [Alphaproteobacteria bacterium]|nr:LLM class flavin-dependent oxidoreductase [Alphaproteobacteria bacterium]